jgi:beta-galactosidase
LELARSDFFGKVFTGTVYHPRLWTLDQPVLYAATTELQLGDAIIETQKTPFGIRTFTFDAQQGFSLNGQAMKLHGLCMHHDLGALGAAINSLLPGHGTFA